MSKAQRRIAVELPEELESKVASMAERTGRSQSELVTDALETYLANAARWQTDMDAALSDIDSGGHDGDDVLKWLESWGTDSELTRPPLSTGR